jgi:hypothetical protein
VLESICLSDVTEIIDPSPSALVKASERNYKINLPQSDWSESRLSESLRCVHGSFKEALALKKCLTHRDLLHIYK